MIVVRGDPLFDVTALANVEVVVKDGVSGRAANRGDPRDRHHGALRACLGPGRPERQQGGDAVELRVDLAGRAPGRRAGTPRTARGPASPPAASSIDSRAYRTQAQNREAARDRLAELVRLAEVRPKRRRKTRAPRAAKERRLETKTRRGRIKAGRGRVGSTALGVPIRDPSALGASGLRAHDSEAPCPSLQHLLELGRLPAGHLPADQRAGSGPRRRTRP